MNKQTVIPFLVTIFFFSGVVIAGDVQKQEGPGKPPAQLKRELVDITSKKKQERKEAERKQSVALAADALCFLAKNRVPFKVFSQEPFTCSAFNAQGTLFALGSQKGMAFIGNPKTGEIVHRLSGHTGAVTWVAFSKDGNSVLSCSLDGTAKIWSAETGKLLNSLGGHKEPLFTGSFSLDGKFIVTGSADRTIKVWNVQSGKALRTIPFGFSVDAVTFCQKSAAVCFTSLNGFVQKEVLGSGAVFRARGPRGPLAVSEFSLDGERLFSGTFIGTVIEWDPQTGKALKVFSLGDRLKIFALAFSSRASKILAGCSDGTARLIDSSSGKELMRFLGKKQSVQSVALTLEGKRAFAITHDGTAFLYDSSSRLVQQLKSTLTIKQASFLKDAFEGRKKGTPLILLTPSECDVLVSFGPHISSYLKELFLLKTDPLTEKASVEAQRDILE